jgi:death-on-curing family protein
MKKENKQVIIYQGKNGEIILKKDLENETIWANQKEIAEIFNVNIPAINKHIKNIIQEKELDNSTISKMEIVQKEGKRKVKREVDYYNLDMLISVGYRINSVKGTKFRKWATKTLKQHITQGFTINPKRIEKNHQVFLKAVEDVKLLAKNNKNLNTSDVLELIKSFSYTWFSLESYDKDKFPKKGTKKSVQITAEELEKNLDKLKQELIRKKEATEIFAQEKQKGNLKGIVGSVFQSVFSKDVYPTVEEKAAHLLYFIIKNHPFNDGNKRSGAFAFIWFLQKAGLNFQAKINPETLATLTILVAESEPKEKEKMIGIILLLLNFEK